MPRTDDSLTIPSTPQWETRAKRPLSGGRWPGIDNSLWLWRIAPMGSVVDAKSPDDAVNVGRPLANAYDELAKLAGRSSNRRQAKGSYRQTHALLINIPALFAAHPDSPIREHLNQQFGHLETLNRVLLFGVKLRPSVSSGGWRSAVASVAETIQFGGAPIRDFDRDFETIDAMLSRNGFSVPDASTLHLADSWWNLGRAAAVPVLAHEEHIHYFHSTASAHRAVAVDPIDCSGWTEHGVAEHAVTFAAVEDLDLRYSRATDPIAQWVVPLLDAGAAVVSVRALVEPARVTRNELRGQIKRYNADLDELAEQGKMDRAELQERQQELNDVERVYATGGPATLTDTSIIVGFDSVIDDIQQFTVNGGPVTLAPMLNRQAAAWHETMVCSSVRANPMLHDLPASTIAFSGLPTISLVGDRDGALLGLTERERQPAFISSDAASEGDALPLMGGYAATRSGKTVLMQSIADQWNRAGVPQLMVNPKQGGSLADFAEYVGGRVLNLADFTSSDGGLDPLRIVPGQTDAVTKAASMIASVNPFGPSLASRMTDISFAIDYGYRLGARATGQALMLARDAGVISPETVDPIFRFAETFPMFRATFGMKPSEDVLSLSHGLTLVEVGNSSFSLPPQGFQGEPGDLQDPTQRVSMNIIRMLIWGGMSALRGRGGVIHFDESWIMEKAAPGDLDQIGRLAASWNVLPILYTQRPSGQMQAGLKGYISRGLIGHIKDEQEARAALDMYGLGGNEAMLRRITAPDTLSGGKGANWDSLKALRDDTTGKLLRGAVFYYVDLHGRVAPVEVTLSPDFLKIASTTPADVERRRLERERQAAAEA